MYKTITYNELDLKLQVTYNEPELELNYKGGYEIEKVFIDRIDVTNFLSELTFNGEPVLDDMETIINDQY